MFPDKATVIGDDCYFMATAHAAHDCQLGNGVTLCNGVLLAGHVEVGDNVFMGGLVGIHQFTRVGEFAMLGGGSHLNRDTPPFCMVTGDRPKELVGLNAVGLRRAGFEAETRRALKEAFAVLFRSDGPVAQRLAALDRSVPEVARLAEFVESTKRGVTGIADG